MENFNNEKFQLDLASLTVYTDQISSGLAKAIILKANTLEKGLVSVQYGAVGDSYALNLLQSKPQGVVGGCNPFSNSGSTKFTQPLINLCPIAFEESYCLKDLKKYWYDWNMAKEYKTESLGSFEDVFVEVKMEATASVMDGIMWKGAKTSPKYAAISDANLLLCDGFLQRAYANSASTVNVTKSAMTVANASVVVDTILNQVTLSATQIIDEFRLYLQPADFQNYLLALRNLNLFNYTTESRNIQEIYHPGSIGMLVTKVNGLGSGASGAAGYGGVTPAAASGTFLATTKENIWVVISSTQDLSYDMFYDKLGNDLKSRMEFKMGTGFYMPELVVRSA